jgi:HPt (histidine-containing phosphotransfer) domain-containing protein
LEEFNNLNKMELEEQRNYENRIENKDKKADEVDNEKTLKKRKSNEDDYNEIYKILSKFRQEKMKDNDSNQKNTEDQNRFIEQCVHGIKQKSAGGDKSLLDKRDP